MGNYTFAYGYFVSSLSKHVHVECDYLNIVIQMRTRSKESLPHIEDVLAKLRPSEFKDNHLAAYKVSNTPLLQRNVAFTLAMY